MNDWTREDEEFFTNLLLEFEESKPIQIQNSKPLKDFVEEISLKTKEAIQTIDQSNPKIQPENPKEKPTETKEEEPPIDTSFTKPKKQTSRSKWFEQNQKVFEKEQILDKYEEFILEKEQEVLQKIVNLTNPELSKKIFQKKVSN